MSAAVMTDRGALNIHWLSMGSLLRHLPAVDVGVQQMVRTLRQGLAQILGIKRLYIGIFVREADRRLAVEAPKDVASALGALFAVVDGLTAAACAAAGTGHDFDEIIRHAAGFDGFHQLSCVRKAAHDRRADGARAGNVERGFLPALHAAHGGERIRIRFLPVTR